MAPDDRRDQFVAQSQIYRKNAFKLIKKMMDWCDTPGSKPLMNELLHSIFFLARICPVPFSPEEILADEDILRAVKATYPDPFQHLDQFPQRSPFSSALDLVILKLNPENEGQILSNLQDIVRGLEQTFPVSATICISQTSKSSPRHYGVSMSTTSCNPNFQVRKFMIAASCCGPWDGCVAGAVMTFLSNKIRGKGNKDFDGTIKVPRYVRCEAFSIDSGDRKPPCKSCEMLFGLATTDTVEWPKGNCAEAESLSKLFKQDEKVKKEVTKEGTERVREKIKADILDCLQKVLKGKPYNIEWRKDFYPPLAVS